MAALGAIAIGVGAVNLQGAKEARLSARRALVTNFARNVDVKLSLGGLADDVTALHLDPADPSAAAAKLESVRARPGGDPITAVLLLGPSGERRAASPASAALPPGGLDSAWERARAGETDRTATFTSDGAVVTAALLPVGSPVPWGVVVAVQPVLQSARQSYYEGIGSQNGRPGGLVYVDRAGAAVNSWNRAEVGRPALGPTRMSALAPESVVWTEVRAGREWTRVGSSVNGGFALVFEQDTEALYEDLVAAQRQRDGTTVAVLVGAIAALLAFQLSRERAARRAAARIRALMENSQDVIVVCDDRSRIVFASASLPHLIGIAAGSWRGRLLTEVCHRDDAAALTALLASPEHGPLLDVRLIAGDGQPRWFDVEASDMRGLGQEGATLLTFREIAERKALQEALEFQASHDPLTGLENRSRLTRRLDEHISEGVASVPLALLYLDLDCFKPVNDTMGHEAGDDVLRVVARRLVDGVGPSGHVCRLGGDEFAVLLVDAGEREACALADRLLASVRSPISVMGRMTSVGASIGVALLGRHDRLGSPDLLIRRADRAMYAAKQQGRCAYCVAPPGDEDRPDLPDGDVPDGDVPGRAEDRSSPALGPVEALDASAPAPSPPGGDADEGSRPSPAVPGQLPPRRRLAAYLPLLVAGAVVVTIALVGQRQSDAWQEAAEAGRLAEQELVAVHSAEYYASLGSFERFAGLAERVPWALDGGPIDRAIVERWARASQAGPGATSTLARLDGRTIVAYPARAAMNLAVTSDAWQAALQGRVGFDPLVIDADQPRAYVTIPVARDGVVRAVLVVATSDREGAIPRMLGNARTTGYDHSGWSLVRRDGRIFASWDPDLVGTAAVDPALLADLAVSSTRSARTSADDAVIVTPLPGYQFGISYFAYIGRGDEIFGDLRVGREARDLTLAGVVTLSIAALALINFRRVRAERLSESRLDTLLRNAHDVVVVLDDDGRARYVSSAVHRMLGFAPDDMADVFRSHVHPDDQDRVAALLSGVERAPAPQCLRDVRVRDAAGDERWFDIDAVDLHHHPEVGGVLLTFHDITERKALQDQMAFRAGHDALTSLANRSALGQRLEQLAAPDAGPFAVLFIDLDRFKPINDEFGHPAGDEVLRVVARRLTGVVRAEDLVCRLGGDEFAVVLHDADEDEARGTAERLLAVIPDPIRVGDAQVCVSATIGVALSHPDDDHPELTVRNADRAMYQSKETARGTYSLFLERPDRPGRHLPDGSRSV